MISYLKGRAVLFKYGLIIIETGGVGYKVFVNPQIKIKNNIVDTQENIELYIYEHIREDADDFYGFLTYQELELFEKLISVNGVGPKAGLNIMSHAESDKILYAIMNDDMAFFTAISGVGKKVAAKIILDLKSKISSDKSINIIGKMDESNDLIDALESLGYKKSEIQDLVGKIPPEIILTEEKVRWCLRSLSTK